MMRKLKIGLSVVGFLLAIVGCGGLSSGDKKVCEASFYANAKGVLDVVNLAEDKDILNQAKEIRFNRLDSFMKNLVAMDKINRICKKKGWEE